MAIWDRDYMRQWRREALDSSYEPTPDGSRSLFVGGVVVLALIISGAFFLSTCTNFEVPKRIIRSERSETDVRPKHTETPAPTPVLLININTATAAELDSVPYIGPSLAEKIIAHRPYATLEDLTSIPGIKERMLERIRPFISVK